MLKTRIFRSLLLVNTVAVLIFAYFITRFSPEQRWTPFFINKALAETSMILIGMSFLLGPLCRILPFLRKHLHLRRYFGLSGFVAVVFHLISSFIQYTSRFPLKWYQDHWWGVLAATVGFVIFTALAATSTTKAIVWLGGKNWKTLQRTGYIAVFLVLLHIYAASSARWQMWFQGKVSMPSSFVVFVFGVIVIVARLISAVIDMMEERKLQGK